MLSSRMEIVVTQIFSFLLMFIMPALTTGSISGERERRTLELLFTTQMPPGDIVMGKLFSALSQLLVLVVSSFQKHSQSRLYQQAHQNPVACKKAFLEL